MNQSLRNKRILITCGPTWIPVDDTRIISNISTGKLGQIIAKDLSKVGCKVTLLEGPVKRPLKSSSIAVKKFCYYDEFLSLVKNTLKRKYDIIIHAAAVSDYKLKRPFSSKISSTHKKLTLELVPTRKIINLIKRLNPKAFLVGFKLKSALSKEKAKQESKVLFEKAKCDLVIANSLNNQKYGGYILDKNNTFLAFAQTRQSISKSLVKVLRTHT